ncbi:D-serine ammonia-lyase [Oceanobacillus piezotolerans]|uniref:Probable D-serine dehydratase n=2 Tax=Oceanobacillus piezotolerans TaxID=2448030 RepID=A0A498DER9_9BACI|nr:D-serine ammonia-lyase [Oceanobacillus piezotolerans]RLL47150.1 D-serine ammonia-lyase [Oceanobacillus piezotolerans]
MTKKQWIEAFPLLNEIIDTKEILWKNPDYRAESHSSTLSKADIEDAAERLERFSSYIAKVFPETAESAGLIESPLITIPKMQKVMEDNYHIKFKNPLLLKCDSHLPISGSIKARGGIYEVLKHAEELAMEHGYISVTDDYSIFDNPKFKELFSNYRISVGSTGNLGLSIGIMSAQLGFQVSVHMSADAKQWKKDLLRSKGVHVVEYQSDFSNAVSEGRKQAEADPACHFIDDEDSKDLFLGYSVAAARLKKQLKSMNITIDREHPLFVYLPCGVGGGPGGITFGLHSEFGENVHCIFAEPTNAPSFLLGQMTGLQDKISVQDFGISNKTEADGLAVGRTSSFVGKEIGHLVKACYTIEDARLYSFLRDLSDTENILLEPSALAGFYGPIKLMKDTENLQVKIHNAYHLIWATGGNMVPPEVQDSYYQKGAVNK